MLRISKWQNLSAPGHGQILWSSLLSDKLYEGATLNLNLVPLSFPVTHSAGSGLENMCCYPSPTADTRKIDKQVESSKSAIQVSSITFIRCSLRQTDIQRASEQFKQTCWFVPTCSRSHMSRRVPTSQRVPTYPAFPTHSYDSIARLPLPGLTVSMLQYVIPIGVIPKHALFGQHP